MSTKIFQLVVFFLYSSVIISQSWNYNFANKKDSVISVNSIAGNTNFLSATPANGGTYKVKVGSAGGSIDLVPDSVNGSSLKIIASSNLYTNKFTVYGWSPSSTSAYLKCKLKTASTDNGTLAIEIGSGEQNSVYTNFYSYLNGLSTSLVALLINYQNGNIISIQENEGGNLITIPSSGIISNTYQTFEFFVNNSSRNITYLKNGIINLNSQKWDLWLNNTKLSPNGGFGNPVSIANVSLAAQTPIDGFGFFAESSNANAASMNIDSLAYTSVLPDTYLTASPSLSFGTTCTDNTNAIDSFVLTGNDLKGSDVKITPLAGYKFSTDINGMFADSLILNNYGATLNKKIYTKLFADSVGVYDGNICIVGGGADSINLPVSGNTTQSNPSLISSIIDINCPEDTTGAIDLTINDGIGPFTFNWIGPDSFYSSSQSLANVRKGTYTVTVNSFGGCTTTANYQIVSADSLAVRTSYSNITCQGCSTTLNVDAVKGSGMYNYSLNGSDLQTDSSFTVTAGTYIVAVSDSLGCVVNTPPIIINDFSSLTATALPGKINCYGSTTILTVKAKGGLGGYNYSLNGYTPQTDSNFNINAGSYQVTVQDVAGNAFTTDSILIDQPLAPLQVSAIPGVINCYNELTTLQLSATGGVSPYLYSLNNGTPKQDGNFNIKAGKYLATVTDSNDCIVNSDSILINQPLVITANLSSGSISCNKGNTNLKISASGGTSPYTYSLNGSSYQADSSFIVNAGKYEASITDNNGCVINTDSITITQPLTLTAKDTLLNAIQCKSGTTTVMVSALGGTQPYSGTGNFIISEGTYNYTVTDAKGCTASTSIIVSDGIATVPAKPGNISGNTSICGGGNFTYSISAVKKATGYNWTVPSGCSIASNNSTSISVQVPSNFISGNISVTALNACGNGTASSLALTTLPSKTSAISGPTSVASKQKGLNYSVTNVAGISYLWTVPTGATIVSGQGTSSVVVNWKNNSGTIAVTSNNNCGSAAAVKLNINVPSSFVNENTRDEKNNPVSTDKKQFAVGVYPNPTTGKITLFYNDKLYGNYSIIITDIAGKIVRYENIIDGKGITSYKVDISDLSNGIYLITFKNDETIETFQIVKTE